MNRQELSYKTTITFVISVAILCSAISGFIWYERGIIDTIPKVKIHELKAQVLELNLENQKKVIEVLRSDSTSAHFTIDSLALAFAVAKRITRQTQDSLKWSRKTILRKDVTIDSSLAVIDSLEGNLLAKQDTIKSERMLIAGIRKGKDLLEMRLDNAAAESALLRDSIYLLLPNAIEKNKLRQENYNFRFGFYFLLVVLIIVGYGIRRGWFIKRRKKLTYFNDNTKPINKLNELVETQKPHKLSPDLFKKKMENEKIVDKESKSSEAA